MFLKHFFSSIKSNHAMHLDSRIIHQWLSLTSPFKDKPFHCYIQTVNYVEVKMKWKKDVSLDSIPFIDRSQELKSIISLKNCIKKEGGNIPISLVSKRGYEFDIPSIRVATFLRQYPSIFEEFTGEKYNLPWFRLTQEAIDLDKEEQAVYKAHCSNIVERLKKLLLMSKGNMLPLKVIRGLQWYLGFPDEFLGDLELLNSYGHFELIEMEDDLKGLRVLPEETVLSAVQKIALARGDKYVEGSPPSFTLVPSKGLRLKKKLEKWLDEFQKLPYVSPYEDSSHLNPNSDIAEKHVVGVLHELLSLFVENSAQRRKLICLRKYLGLPQKFSKAFERHPSIFYLSLKNRTCTAILKEAFAKGSMIEKHPVLDVRKQYLKLINKSRIIMVSRRQRKAHTEVKV
ncbi:protein WHAT'S THIS FACTOR 9, mitochondrial [Nymphaea colorata]|nr:protein WHAT'S THIS FACTOR 9, mitochondrial [Nymphaea colorata]XP_031501435.1 protein WHAT'S THIS FACTOR 9, mitochondrial [Nymphaea colorata]XP_031501444.1 protein WHAT'S THIS FACTOR 9, mitochondrial [Nymphaea colorata]XP_031501452.1 protein WHAT'S THIS FACTOR 9, mitochondrial [Nymphaea colorata]XP_031501460.1 protein WHAT'S THIS FACTOR 9, mitochondrial [Nymphaea colorata]XP_031501468.1 protein WHAT'S THIS FACTOR 9, mitochondrial [Nymphaea colorata]